VEDWDFGLTTRGREPKPALAAVRSAFSQIPFRVETSWPKISVVVCTHNGSQTLAECLREVLRVDYPNYELIVVDDGSTDNSKVIASQFACRLISTRNAGLSSARNTGLAAATGEIVAYLDDDAYPDPHWLKYLAEAFNSTSHCGIGGPNLVPPEDPAVAQCVGNAPGGPIHVLLTDTVAEHIPGCNMAFRKSSLTKIGGFDPLFHTAGDDVDLCWRLQEMGWTIGFSPAAVVWHHRRKSIRAFLKQQKGYGQAEAMLQRKWPGKFNVAGNAVWSGRLYGAGLLRALGVQSRVYHGAGGNALFQPLHLSVPSPLSFLRSMPDWSLIILFLVGLSALGGLWPKLFLALPLLALLVGLSAYQAATSAGQATRFGSVGFSPVRIFGLRLLTFLLCLLQPIARLWGRLSGTLLPGRSKSPPTLAFVAQQEVHFWSQGWHAPQQSLVSLESAIRAGGDGVVHGGAYDSWDLEVRGGLLGAVRLLMTVEEHGGGRQMFRYRLSPRSTGAARLVLLPLTGLAWAACLDGIWPVAVVLGAICAYLMVCSFLERSSVMAVVLEALEQEHCSHSVRTREVRGWAPIVRQSRFFTASLDR
jgi:GT2 family glycosyltransferase